jgi:hypothetical protein
MSEIAVDPSAARPEDHESPVEMSEQERNERDYYKWLANCNAKYLEVQNNYGSCVTDAAARYKPQRPAWEDERLDDTARQQVWAGGRIIDMNKKKRIFSQAAILLASSHDHARFFDDIKCDYLGDSKQLGRFKEISPQYNHTPFEVQHNYNQGRLNSFAGNTIIHVRETLDPAATTRSQRLFIVAIDLIRMDVQRLYADDKPRIESLDTPERRFNEIISLTTQTLKGMEMQLQVSQDNPLRPYVHELFENHTAQMQAQLMKSASNGWQYKPEGYAEYSKLRPIEQLDDERMDLRELGKALGHSVTDRGAILPMRSQPGIVS